MVAETRLSSKAHPLTVGIDPSSRKLHVSVVFFPEGEKPKKTYRELPIQASSFAWFEDLRRQYGEFPIAIEGSGLLGEVALLELQSRGMNLWEVSPIRSKGARELFGSHHEDETDATVMAYAARFVPGLTPIRTSQTKSALKQLTRVREMLLEHQIAGQRQLQSLLRQTYGAVYQDLFLDTASLKALRFFTQFPTINGALDRLADVTLALGDKKAKALEQAGRFTVDVFLQAVGQAVLSMVEVILKLKEEIRALDRQIRKQAEQDREVQAIRRCLNVKASLLPSTIVANLQDIGRFSKESKAAAYAGLGRVRWVSGKTNTSRKRMLFHRRLKRALMLLAHTKVIHDPDWHKLYQKYRDMGMWHWRALKRVARKLMKINYYELRSVQPDVQNAA